jgi:hypothetical protein
MFADNVVINLQIPAFYLCSQPTAIFIFGIARFARSELTVHCEHPGEPQLNTCGFVFSIFCPSNNFSNNLSNKKHRRKQQ